MKRILFFLLLLLNLQITIDNGSLNIGLGEVFAQRLQESTITKSYYAATYTCQWCWYPFGYFEDWLKHERKCEYRQEYCPRCDKPTLVRVKDQEQHDNWYHKCSYCCRWMESCICNRCPMCNQNLYLCECDPIEIKGKDKNSNNDDDFGCGFGGGQDGFEKDDFGGGVINAPTSSTTQNWNCQKALDYLKKNSRPFSVYQELPNSQKGKCATYVRKALEAAGFNMNGHPSEARLYGPFLKKLGFKEISPNGYVMQSGDIRVWQPYPGGRSEGHIHIFNGKNWVSDFVEPQLGGPNTGYRKHPNYKIYRK